MHKPQKREAQAKQFINSASSLLEQLRLKSLMDCVSEDEIKRLKLAFANLEIAK